MDVLCPGSSDCTVSLSSQHKNEAPGARPIYVIAHRCNDTEDIGRAISQGANAVECDLQYDEATRQIFVNHDFAAGTSLFEWLNHAKLIADGYGDLFALIIFDVKFAADRDPTVSGIILREVRDAVRAVLTVEPTPINVLFSISSYNMREALTQVMTDLLPNEGIAIDESDEPSAVEAFFSKHNVANCWYGNGIFTLGPKDVYPYLKKGAALRDANGVLKKVYVWTLANKASILKFVEGGGVDGVMVNVPGVIGPLYGLENALTVVRSSSGARMAKRRDPAFALHEWPLKPTV
jgi:glycerophosphoryl diester phosphodiesterase